MTVAPLKKLKPVETHRTRPAPQPSPAPQKTEISVDRPATLPFPQPANFDFVDIIRLFSDAIVRSLIRIPEGSIDGFSRLLYRGGTESLRKTIEIPLFKLAKGQKIEKKDWVDVSTRALENTLGSTFFEPNNYTNLFAKAASGFGNMLVRFAGRTALFSVNVIDAGQLNTKKLVNELFNRSAFRALSSEGFASRLLEQSAINLGLNFNDVKNYVISKVSSKNEAPSLVKQS